MSAPRKTSRSGRAHVNVGDRVRSIYMLSGNEGAVVELRAGDGQARVKWDVGPPQWVDLNLIALIEKKPARAR